MPDAALLAVAHSVRRSLFGYFFMSEMPVVGELWPREVPEDPLLFLCGLLDSFIKLILRGVLHFLFFPLGRLGVPRTMNSLLAARLTRGRNLGLPIADHGCQEKSGQ